MRKRRSYRRPSVARQLKNIASVRPKFVKMAYVIQPIIIQSHTIGAGPGYLISPYRNAMSYALPDMPVAAYNPYNQLYAKFKLKKVELFFRPLFAKHPYNATLNVGVADYNSVERGVNNSIQPPLWIINADNNNLLTTLNNDVGPVASPADTFANIRNAPKAKMFAGNAPFKWTVYPKVQMDALKGTVSTAYVAKQAWLNTNDTTTNHYGTFICADTTGIYDANPFCWMMYARYTVYWKDPYY